MTTYSIDGSPMPSGHQAITISAVERIHRHDAPHYSARISWGPVSFTAQIKIDKGGKCHVLIPCLNPMDYYTFQPFDDIRELALDTPAIIIDAHHRDMLNAAALAWYWQQEQAITASRLDAIQRNLNAIEGAR